MASSSTDDIPTQLTALLGHPIKRIRITDEEPPRISVIDLAAAITMKGPNQAAEQVAYVKSRHPEVTEIFGDFKFRGQGQKKTAVAELRGAADEVRKKITDLKFKGWNSNGAPKAPHSGAKRRSPPKAAGGGVGGWGS